MVGFIVSLCHAWVVRVCNSCCMRYPLIHLTRSNVGIVWRPIELRTKKTPSPCDKCLFTYSFEQRMDEVVGIVLWPFLTTKFNYKLRKLSKKFFLSRIGLEIGPSPIGPIRIFCLAVAIEVIQSEADFPKHNKIGLKLDRFLNWSGKLGWTKMSNMGWSWQGRIDPSCLETLG